MPQMFMDHGDQDPAEKIIEEIGYIDDIEVPLNKVLIGVYIRPTKMRKITRVDGSIAQLEVPESVVDEDRYQGKACVIIKKGPLAFVDDDKVSFHGFCPEVKDWVVIRPSDGLKMSLNKVLCVLLSDTQIQLKIPAPDIVF